MQRPEIICHMVTSLDGRLLPDRWPFSEDHIMSMYEATAAKLDASGWAVGRATMLHYVDEGEPDLPELIRQVPGSHHEYACDERGQADRQVDDAL